MEEIKEVKRTPAEVNRQDANKHPTPMAYNQRTFGQWDDRPPSVCRKHLLRRPRNLPGKSVLRSLCRMGCS